MSEETDAWSSRTLLGLGNLNLDVWEGNTNCRDAVTLTIADHVGTNGRDAIGDQYAVSPTTFSGVGG